jgi:hypothetical protein
MFDKPVFPPRGLEQREFAPPGKRMIKQVISSLPVFF